MAANIMVEVLKQMQQDLTDQKDYMRNINKKLSNLNDKVDQQQVTLERLEQHVIKNNKLLFGNDESDINIKELSVMLYKPECNDNKQVNLVENDVASQQEKTSKTDDLIHTRDGDKVEELIAEEPAEMKAEHEEAESSAQEETARVSSSYFNIQQINQLHFYLKQTMSEITKIKESIEETVTTRKTPVGVTSDQMSNEENIQVSPTCVNSEQDTLKGELKQIMAEVIEIKKLMKETIGTKINPIDETASPVWEQETVQLSLNYLSADQISKLNGELKQITENYQSTNIFPVVELIPGPALSHPVMNMLSDGVSLRPKTGIKLPWIELKLGLNGFKRSVVQDLLAEYPFLSLRDIVQEVLTSRKEWNDLMSNYNLNFVF